jgi:hypothetical protein
MIIRAIAAEKQAFCAVSRKFCGNINRLERHLLFNSGKENPITRNHKINRGGRK